VGHSKTAGFMLIAALVVSTFWIVGWLVFVLVTLIVAAARRNF
jgi:hypothetical protein